MPAVKSSAGVVSLRGELVSFNRRTDDGWGFGSLRVEGYTDPVKITGKVLGAKPGDTLEVEGSWVDHESFGRQFKIKSTVTSAPSTVDGVTAWLAATLPGIGHKRAAELVEHFGGVEQLWDVIEKQPARLSEISGVTDAAAQRIHTAYVSGRAGRDHQIALRGWGLSDSQISRCLETWKTLDLVVREIKTNPYQLAALVHGFGFLKADQVALRSGIAHNDPSRIMAGIVHTLEDATSEGHTWIFGGALQRIASVDVLHVSAEDVGRGIQRATKTKMIVRRGKRCYAARMELAEAKAARGVLALLDVLPGPTPANDNSGQTVH